MLFITHHMRNVLTALHWGLLQYHMRASTIGLQFQMQEDTKVLSEGRNEPAACVVAECVLLFTHRVKCCTYADTHWGCQQLQRAMASG